MMTEIDTVKGFQDFLPEKAIKRREVKKIIEKWFQLYGFLPLETPIIEFDEAMRPTVLPSEQEDEAVSSRFKLKDRGGRNLGLRYEFTFQLARVLKMNPTLKLPFKRYQIGEVFRDEPISQNRFRQFTQCDADIIGEPSINADAECLALFSDILKELKIDFEIEVNNRALLNAIIDSVEIGEKSAVMKTLDKIDKIGTDEIKTELRKYTSANQIITLFRLLEKDLKFFKENAFPGVDQLQELMEICEQYDIKIKFSPYLMRGLAYYTGNIFEIKTAKQKGSIAGGGRYNKTVGRYLGREIPAVGISFGLERITDLAKIEIKPPIKALLISISQDLTTIQLAKKLRKENVSCTIQLGRPSKGLDFANSQAIPFVIFIGEEEIGKKKFKIKNMSTGKEELLTEAQLIKKLKR